MLHKSYLQFVGMALARKYIEGLSDLVCNGVVLGKLGLDEKVVIIQQRVSLRQANQRRCETSKVISY